MLNRLTTTTSSPLRLSLTTMHDRRYLSRSGPRLAAGQMELDRLPGSTLEGFTKEQELCLVVDGKHTSASYPTENVRPSALEERPNAFLGNDLAPCVEGRLVLHGLGKKRD